MSSVANEVRQTSAAQPDSRPRAILVSLILAHYRAPIFLELAERAQYRWGFAADTVRDEGGIAQWKPPPTIDIIHTPSRTFLKKIMWQSGLIRLALRRDIAALAFVGNAAWPATWIAALVGRLTGKQIFFWTHGWTKPPRGLAGVFRNTFYRLAHGLFLYGHHAKCLGIDAGFRPERLHVVYNSLDYEAQKIARAGVTTEDERTLRRELFGSDTIAVAICSTRLIALRRLDLLIEAAAALRQQGMNVGLLLVGDGPERANLERLASERAVPTHFAGACYDEAKLARYTMASNVTVAPGKVGLTAMQSLGFGTPVITHDDANNQMPEWEAIIPGRTGALFTNGDATSLANAMRPWLQSPGVTAATREACHVVIDRLYNVAYQRRVIDRALAGKPADDLLWMRAE